MVGAEVIYKALVSFLKDFKAFGRGKVGEVFFGMFSHLSILLRLSAYG
jgi:hypothetical protein